MAAARARWHRGIRAGAAGCAGGAWFGRVPSLVGGRGALPVPCRSRAGLGRNPPQPPAERTLRRPTGRENHGGPDPAALRFCVSAQRPLPHDVGRRRVRERHAAALRLLGGEETPPSLECRRGHGELPCIRRDGHAPRGLGIDCCRVTTSQFVAASLPLDDVSASLGVCVAGCAARNARMFVQVRAAESAATLDELHRFGRTKMGEETRIPRERVP